MTEAADLVLTNAEVHTLTSPDRTHKAVAIRDGEIVRVGAAYEIDFLKGVETRTIDLNGRVLLPGFVDAHTHLEQLGQQLVHADLSTADSLLECLEVLREENRADHEWMIGFGYDESEWTDNQRHPTKEDLNEVSEERPVAAVRVDMHTAAVNSVALDRISDEVSEEDIRTVGGEPTGVVVEDAVGAILDAIEPDVAETHELLTVARDHAHAHGITCVHDMIRDSHAPRVYRELDRDNDLGIRVRLNYWSDHLDAVLEAGLRPNHGSEFVQMGGIKTFTDGSLGGHTARLSEPYEDADGRGTWVVSPEALRDLVARVSEHELQVTAHAIGDEAIEEVLDALESAHEETGDLRHRIEHAELLTDDQIDRFAESGVVASVQPNFLQWAEPGGLYDQRLGENRRKRTNRYRDLLDAGAPLAFSSDCMPLDPLFGIHCAVNAPVDAQRLDVTEALRAYTHGGAYAGFDEDQLGTVEVGKKADFVALDRSPWEHPEDIENIDVALTVVNGEVVYDERSEENG